MSKHFPEIPRGDYCYTANTNGTLVLCPYYTSKEVNGVFLPWCNHLKMGSVPADAGGLSDANIDALIAAWGVNTYDPSDIPEELHPVLENCRPWPKIPEEFDLFLLWDQCKECGKNSYDHLTPTEVRRHPNAIVNVDVLPVNASPFVIEIHVPKSLTFSGKAKHIFNQLCKLRQHFKQHGLPTEFTLQYKSLTSEKPSVSFAAQIIKLSEI